MEDKFQKELARPERFELPTLCFEGRCSIQLSYGRAVPSGLLLYYAFRRIFECTFDRIPRERKALRARLMRARPASTARRHER